MRTIYVTEAEWKLLTSNPKFYYHAGEKTLREVISKTLKIGPLYGPFKFVRQEKVDVKKRAKFFGPAQAQG